jgi:hypothetical protein
VDRSQTSQRTRRAVTVIAALVAAVSLPACDHSQTPAPTGSATPSGVQQQSRNTSLPSPRVSLPPLSGSGRAGPSGLPPLPGAQSQTSHP